MPPAGPLAEVRVQVRRSAFSGTFVGDRQLAVTLQDTPGHAQVPDQSARSPVPLPSSGGQKLVEYWTCMVEGHPMQEIDVIRLDSQGRMTDQTVLLRPGRWSPCSATGPRPASSPSAQPAAVSSRSTGRLC